MKNSKEILSSLLKTTQMGQIGIRCVQKRAENPDLQEALKSQLREYDSILAVLERPEAAPQQRALCISAAHLGSCILLGSPFEMDHADSVALEALLSDIAGLPVYLICYTGGAESYLPSGAPLTENSTYEDFAALYAPESRQTVWRFAEECVRELL